MIIGKESDVSFKVDVHGTSVEPTVKVVIHCHPQLSFPASKVGDRWMASVKIPESIEPGEYEMKVEVLLNGRHFSPVNKKITLERDPASIPAAVYAPEPTPPVEIAKTVVHQEEKIPEPVVEEVAPPAPPKKITLELSKNIFDFSFDKGPAVPVKYDSIAQRKIVETKKIEEPKKPIKVAKPKPPKIVEIKHGIPVKLTKGEIIYE